MKMLTLATKILQYHLKIKFHLYNTLCVSGKNKKTHVFTMNILTVALANKLMIF